MNSHTAICFDSFEVEHFIAKKKNRKNVSRIQAYDSTMCGYFCIGFINFMLKRKILLDYTNLFPPSEYEIMW